VGWVGLERSLEATGNRVDSGSLELSPFDGSLLDAGWKNRVSA
jgi:hypothetical protein